MYMGRGGGGASGHFTPAIPCFCSNYEACTVCKRTVDLRILLECFLVLSQILQTFESSFRDRISVPKRTLAPLQTFFLSIITIHIYWFPFERWC